MPALDLTADLPELEPDAPAGPNLELDAAFGALERDAKGTPERQAGDKILPAEDPVWPDIAAAAEDLLQRTHDLRVLRHLAVARLNIAGLGGFAAVLAVIARQLDTRWAHVHPQLDPEDDNDPALRANALLDLASPTRVLRVIRAVPLAASRRAGVVTWRSIAVALGTVEAQTAQEKLTESEIRAAFAETPPARIVAVRRDAAAAIAALDGIAGAFDRHGGYGHAPDLSALRKLLQDIGRYIGLYFVPGEPETAASPPPDPAPAEPAGDMTQADPARASGAATAAAGPVRSGAPTAWMLTAVSTRPEALHLLDIVARYYEHYEPSSPLPLMLARARQLADKGFLEILQELAPDGLMQAQSVVQSRNAGMGL